MSELIQATVASDSAKLEAFNRVSTYLIPLSGMEWDGAEVTVPTMFGDGNNGNDRWGWPFGGTLFVGSPKLIGNVWNLVVTFDKAEGKSTQYGIVFRYQRGGKQHVGAATFTI